MSSITWMGERIEVDGVEYQEIGGHDADGKPWSDLVQMPRARVIRELGTDEHGYSYGIIENPWYVTTLAAGSTLWGTNGDPVGQTLEPVRYKPFSFEDKVKYWEDSK